MKITEFIEKNSMTQRDSDICVSVYKDKDLTEQQWATELESKIDFKKKQTLVKAKIAEIKTKLLTKNKIK